MKTRYIRLLTYGYAMRVVNHVNDMDGCYAIIVVGGISIQADDQSWEKIDCYLKMLGVTYEVSENHPTKTNRGIINSLDSKGVISKKNIKEDFE